MLGKLLKHEFRATGRVMLPVLGVLLCGNDPGLRAAEERLRARGYRWQSIQETVTPPAPPRPVAQAGEGAQHV